MLLTLALAAAAAMVQPMPQPTPLRTFREWIVGCDNGHVCEAWALMPEGFQDDTETYLQLALSRGPEANAPLRLTWDNDLSGPAALSVDGRVIADRATQNMALTPAMIDALRNGTVASLTLRGRPRIEASLSGLSASLLAIDEVQGRVGTRTAAARRGSRPMRAAVPVLPVIVRPPPSSRPPRTISPARAAAIIGPDNARCAYSDRPVQLDAYRLDATHSLVLIDHPCGNGAYNYFTTAMIVDERGRVTPARFEVDPGMGRTGDGPGNEIVGAYYDATSRTIDSHAKGRGIGDCGMSSSFVWNGSRFALASQAVMSACRLRMGFIPVWRATVR
jgi:Protein of unknown function (DUF1176)